jgi:hypothetical protein
LFHFKAISCVIWSLYILVQKTIEEINLNKYDWSFWTKLVVVAIGFTGGVVFMYIQCKMYFQLCNRWRQYNRMIIIQPITEEILKNSKKKQQEKYNNLQLSNNGGNNLKTMTDNNNTTTGGSNCKSSVIIMNSTTMDDNANSNG